MLLETCEFNKVYHHDLSNRIKIDDRSKKGARQEHGFKNEKRVIKENNLIDVSETDGYTSEYDAIAPEVFVYNSKETHKNVSTQIKTIRHRGSVDMGDLFRNAKKDKDFILQVDFYKPPKETCEIIESHILYIEIEEWKKMFQFEHYGWLRECLSEITNRHSDDIKWKEMMADMNKRWDPTNRIVHLAPKRDHKKQKRIQCTIPIKKFHDLLLPKFSKARYV